MHISSLKANSKSDCEGGILEEVILPHPSRWNCPNELFLSEQPRTVFMRWGPAAVAFVQICDSPHSTTKTDHVNAPSKLAQDSISFAASNCPEEIRPSVNIASDPHW